MSEQRVTLETVAFLLFNGETVPRIAKHFNVSRSLIYRYARDHGLPLNKPLDIPSPKARRIAIEATRHAIPIVAASFRVRPEIVTQCLNHYFPRRSTHTHIPAS